VLTDASGYGYLTWQRPFDPAIAKFAEVSRGRVHTVMTPRLFLPTARQLNWLIVIAFLCAGQALYLRHMALENSVTSLACRAGLDTWLCTSFRTAIVLYEHEVFGGVALAAALLNLIRPSLVLLALALAALAFGLVLHNADLSALAAAALILSLARPAPGQD
jgi:hypothetical protein